MEFDGLTDKELYEKLEASALAEKITDSGEWRLLKKAVDRIIEKAIKRFALQTDPANIAEVIEIKYIIRKYKFGLFEEVRLLRDEGELYFEELKSRGANFGSLTPEK